jgi:transcriptional regulator with XRE-family HTH domain
MKYKYTPPYNLTNFKNKSKVAKELNISRTTLSKLENGYIANISIVTLNDVLNQLGHELDIKPINPFISR